MVSICFWAVGVSLMRDKKTPRALWEAIIANAVVCGAISNPNDRYGARMAWLAPFVLVLAGLRAADRNLEAFEG